MPTVIEEAAFPCPECGLLPDKSSGLCLACLMRWASAPAPNAEGSVQHIGSYEVLDEIGRGGMGVIYEARQTLSGRIVAMKVLQNHVAQNPDALARFRREAQAAARLDHPHVLPIFEVNEEADGVPFFTMKLAPGGSLIARLAALRGRPREVVVIMEKVARATHHAHERGVLHRDLKPGNILFDANDEPMVSDFGLAAWLHQDSDLTRTIMVFGTPGYLPPEYLEGRPEVLVPASDIYSLGVILFEMLAGRQPFAGGNALHTLREAARKPAPPLRTVLPGADRDLETVCARCLEADPALRYRTAAALADDMQRWLCGRPIVARPTPRLVVAWKMVRRHRALALAACVCLFRAGIGLILNRLRENAADQLARATAYDRTVVVLPTEDLDELNFNSSLAREGNAALLHAARQVPGLSIIAAKFTPEPLPRDGELAPFSRLLGGRYLVSASVRRRESAIRIAIQLLDAEGHVTLFHRILETPSLDAGDVSHAIRAALGAIQSGSPAASRSIDGDTAPGTEAHRLSASYMQAAERHMGRRTPQDMDLAITAYEKAANLEPGNAEAISRLASAMTNRSLFDHREDWLRKALPIASAASELAPDHAAASRVLSDIFFLQGKYSSAMEHALRAYEIDPSDAKLANCVADTLSNLGQLDRALAWNRKATLRQTAPGEYALPRGDCLAALGQFDLARKAYREFIEFRGELADGPLAIAHLDLLEDNIPLALQEIRELHRRFPAHPIVAQTRACMEFDVGDPGEAQAIFESLGDNDACLNAYLGLRVCSALGFLALRRGEESGRALIEHALQLDETHLAGTNEDIVILIDKAANLTLLGRHREALQAIEDSLNFPYWTYFYLKVDIRLKDLRETHQLDHALEVLSERMVQMQNANTKRAKTQ